MQTSSGGRKRPRGRPAASRGRKRQKRLDSIRDRSPPAPTPPPPRRSSRPRRPPDVLDSSPFPSSAPSSRRHHLPKFPNPRSKKAFKNKKKKKKKRLNKSTTFTLDNNAPEAKEGYWSSRLRSRAPKRPTLPASRSWRKVHDAVRVAAVVKEEEEEEELAVLEVRTASTRKFSVGESQAAGSEKKKKKKKKRRKKKRNKKKVAKKGEVVNNADDTPELLPVGEGAITDEEDCKKDEVALAVKDDGDQGAEEEGEEKVVEKQSGDDGGRMDVELENMEVVGEEGEGTGRRSHEKEKTVVSPNEVDDGVGVREDDMGAKALEEEVSVQAATLSDVFDGVQVKEGRRCGLCGRGHDGKPPKRLIHEPPDSENEVYNGLSAAEEPNYDVWDGFGDEPEWLGRLLGPIRDHLGIARVWVHQNCAVWSPEVYFAGLGCLKNVRAALCRGRALKCCRCGRPGATIGCRVDRCPRTYHLPCARADGSIFDHRKFLIACSDHRHLFQPRGELYVYYMKKQKTKKMKLDMRKMSSEAHRRDLEAEEKWLENCGEDEEFLKRESKRLHRDILRIAPIYIGGSSTENTTTFRGWESVAGLHDVIRCMKEIVILPLLYPEFFSSIGLTPPRGVLLHGHSGTGKTLVVRALIGECAHGDKRIAYFARKGADCLGKYVGDAERQLRLLFQVAEKSQPSIIFFDEIDGLAPCRSKRQDQTHSSVVSTLLSLMDGLKSRGSVIVIGATNRPDAIDPALRRPGRFDREVYFPLPSAKDRSSILSLHTQHWPRPLSEPILTWIVKRTVGYAGADLQALCTQAAIIALKRNCPLQEILSLAERGSCSGKLPHLPSIVVEERDWLACLSQAPPPCSRREAGIAANDIVSLPLQYCLLHCLIHPVTQLLISLYFEERIWLPPAILRASKSIRNRIISKLDQKNLPHLSWISHLHDLVQDPDVVQEVERSLLCSGLLVGLSSCSHGPDDGTYGSTDKFDSYRENPNDHALCGKNFYMKWGNLSGFRVLIAGSPRSGQQHLAACIIHGFIGHVDIQKINLATISQEGHGDIIQGLTQLLSKCFSLSHCVIYMPRIDLWAVDEICQLDTDEDLTVRTVGSSNHKIDNKATRTSQAWDSFVEQVNSACTSESLIILGTSEVQIQELPHGVRHFFTNTSSSSTNHGHSGHTIPRFSVHVEGKVNPELLIDLAAARLTGELVQQYIQNLHLEIHSSNKSGGINDRHISCIISEEHPRNKNCPKSSITCQAKSGHGNGCHMSDTSYQAQQAGEVIESTETMLARSDPERISSNNGSSIKENTNHNHASVDVRMSPSQKEREGGHDSQVVTQHKLALRQPVARGIQLAISSLGFQILRFPHFAELCWATSKLKEGPAANITIPVKSWPFNSCIIHDNNFLNKVGTGSNTKTLIDGKGSSIVRGLLAVGLLAQKGAYTSVREVALEVRKVLELFVGEVNAKILGGKDRVSFHRILSQVAHLEDMVNSWAYALQSQQVDNQLVGSNATEALDKNTTVECQAGPARLLDMDAMQLNGFGAMVMPQESVRNLDPSSANGHKSTIQPQEQDSVEDMVSNGEGHHRNESTVALPACASGGHEMSDDWPQNEASLLLENNLHNQDGMMPADNGAGESGVCHTGLGIVIPSIKDDTCHSDELQKETDHRLSKNNDVPVESEISCSYDCCTECLHMLHARARELLASCWQSKGCCTTVDDIMNIVASCSATTLASSLRCQASQSIQGPNDCSTRLHELHSRFCSCKVNDWLLKERPLQNQDSDILFGSPVECSCHPREEANSHGRVSASGMPSKFVFRNNTVIPLAPKNAKLHCNFAKLCLCCLIPSLLKAKDRATLGVRIAE